MDKPLLCSLNAISEGSAKGVIFDKAGRPQAFIVVRKPNSVYVYENRCPHLGLPLEWEKDQFLSPDGSMIQCHSHGALFTIEEGLCVSGPCTGAYLSPVAVEIAEGNIYLQAV